MSRLRAGVKAFVVRRRHASAEAARRRLGQPDGALPESLWDVGVGSDDHLTVCGQDATSLADRYGTPLHVVNRPRLRKDFGRFRQAFARHWPNVQIGYSYKTNPLPGVLRDLHDCGAWAEVISHFELWLAFELGVPPERIIYNGPAKSSDGLRLAISRGIAIINVDNVAEIGTIDAIARSLGTRQRAGVRVVTSVGWSGQFGHSIADGEADAAFALLASSSSIDACGLHVHLGTGIKDVDTYLQAIREVLEFARKVERDHRIRISHLDFGGGFGVPTVRPFDIWDERLMALGFPPAPIDPSTPPTIEAVAERIVSLLHAYFRTHDAGRLPMLLFEPGRAVTSSAQTLLLRVLAVKRGPDGSRRVILDGGKNLALPTGYEMHELLPASAMRAPRHSLHYFYGPLCHPGDVIARAKRFPDVAAGDIVAVMDAGAYFIPNQMNFSNPRAAAVMVDTDRVWPIRDRESFADIVRHDHWSSAAQDAPLTAIVT